MKFAILIVTSAVALSAGAAAAQPVGENPPKSTIICVDPGGRSLPAVCHVPSSRLDQTEYFCSCPEGQRVDVAICAKGVAAPADSAALDRARREQRKGFSLIGATYMGQPLCVAPRNPMGH